ncbi:ABC transporter permease [Aquimarina gracilis]|uniref:ABC transporter permease n=1 Tax=Aquimarina gracilis TaxID=874422 RepID=A0ABU5ZWV2_9FLAO|nr:ABC transporter permease [Aquimarina gracilis]MEB3346358.1 ABC transporter permease [Aquimarina gracilis]
MESVKKLFTLKKVESKPKSPNYTDENHGEQVRITYYQSGYGASKKASGSPITLRTGLHNLYNSFEDQCRKQLAEQQRLKQPYREEQERQRTELKKRETAIVIYEEQENNINRDIEIKKHEMVDVKQNPDHFGIDADKRPKAQFYIGLFILLPISIYLLVFYISASYSAFFKEFSNTSLTAAIFDPNALTNAIKASWLEGLLVITIPFVFMGLGYVIHMVQKRKGLASYLKIGLLFLVTFLFDGLLAYIIEKKIYDFNRTPSSEPYGLTVALEEAEFWMIIFAGFVVYIIWGLVFDFVMKEYENVDKIKAFIRAKKEELRNLLDNKTELLQNIDKIKHEITSITGKISELQSQIDGFVFPVKEYLHYHYQYKEGWYQFINSELAMTHDKKQQLLDECEMVSAAHLNEHQLNQMDHQHLLFTKKQL